MHMIEQIIGAVESAESELGFRIPNDVWSEVLVYSHQKLAYIQKPVEYLPILFKNELFDFYTRLEINTKGVANHVQRMLAVSVSSQVS